MQLAKLAVEVAVKKFQCENTSELPLTQAPTKMQDHVSLILHVASIDGPYNHTHVVALGQHAHQVPFTTSPRTAILSDDHCGRVRP